MPAALLVMTVLGGCMVARPEDRKIPVELPASFSAGGLGERPEKWWTVLEDPALNGLMDRAMSGSFTLRSTWDRLAQARASARREGAALLPSVDSTGGGSGSASGTVDHRGNTTRTESVPFTVGLAANYEIDLWGRIRSAAEAASLDVLASEQDVHAAAMTLSAEVAASWIRLTELRGQIALLDEQIGTSEEFLKTVTIRFKGGQVPATDVLQQRQALESVQGEKVRLLSNLTVERNRLAVLVGRAPTTFEVPSGTGLPGLPALPETGTPAQWVNRRPDLRAAYLRLRSADWRTASAVADRFPRISLSGRASVGWDGTNAISSWLTNLAANLLGPLMDGGRRKAEVDRNRAAASQRLHEYGQALLRAVEEVENALVREARQGEYIGSLDKQIDLSRQSVNRALAGYRKGTVDFTRFLNTTLTHQRLERTRLAARRDRVLHRIALYRALGGSWKLDHPKKG
jgi:NodT family efflux transporter outer membrane factor (OMF) lipoprotein